MTIVPIGNNVVLKRKPAEESSAHGIFLPDCVKQPSNIGKVLAVGDGRLLPTGKRSPLQVNEGDRVLFEPYQAVEISVEGEKYIILPETSILAILT